MKKRIGKITAWVATGVLVAWLTMAASSAKSEFTNFTVTEVKGRCNVIKDGAPTAIQANQSFAFGTTIQTGRSSSMKVEFDENNVFLVQARTTVVVTEDVNNPKLKILQLQRGQVDLSLDKYPKDHKLEVETPTAVCGAVGTRFVVSFEDDAKDENAQDKLAHSRQTGFSCDRGEVFVASRFSVSGKAAQGDTMNVPSLTAGTAIVATIHEGLENSYTDVSVNRGKLTFEYGGEKGNKFDVAPVDEQHPTRFVCALEKSDKNVGMAAVKVENGTVTSTKTSGRFLFFGGKTTTEDITPADGTVVVKDNEVAKEMVEQKDAAGKTEEVASPEEDRVAADYIAAAKVEGELHSEWVDVTAAGNADPALEAKVKAAATKATALRKNLAVLRTVRTLRQIRNATRPRAPRMP